MGNILNRKTKNGIKKLQIREALELGIHFFMYGFMKSIDKRNRLI